MPDGRTGEAFVGSSADRDEQFDWRSWCDSVNAYLHQLEAVLHPDLIVIGGGVSIERDVAHWMGLLRTRATVTPARFRNFAGVVGAAMAAAGQAGVPE